MEEIIFGVDSKFPANKQLKNGYTIYEWISRQRCFPSFWGRDLLGDNAITKSEIEFLKEKNVRLNLL